MLLECVNAFGNFAPGDEVEVPDDALFDTAFFRRKAPESVNDVEDTKPSRRKEGNK
jgi:hypothetical protein